MLKLIEQYILRYLKPMKLNMFQNYYVCMHMCVLTYIFLKGIIQFYLSSSLKVPEKFQLYNKHFIRCSSLIKKNINFLKQQKPHIKLLIL